MKIETSFIYPPIPVRDYDWMATTDNYEEGDIIGFGKTELDAKNDLIKQFMEANG